MKEIMRSFKDFVSNCNPYDKIHVSTEIMKELRWEYIMDSYGMTMEGMKIVHNPPFMYYGRMIIEDEDELMFRVVGNMEKVVTEVYNEK